MAIWHTLNRYRDLGLFIIRLGLGVMFIYHGYPKLIGGPDKWAMIGGSMKNVGITFAPAFWGLMAALTEALGGMLIVLGLWFRPVCLLLVVNMVIAAISHLAQGQGLSEASHAIEDGIVFLGLLVIGPGKYSLDRK